MWKQAPSWQHLLPVGPAPNCTKFQTSHGSALSTSTRIRQYTWTDKLNTTHYWEITWVSICSITRSELRNLLIATLKHVVIVWKRKIFSGELTGDLEAGYFFTMFVSGDTKTTLTPPSMANRRVRYEGLAWITQTRACSNFIWLTKRRRPSHPVLRPHLKPPNGEEHRTMMPAFQMYCDCQSTKHSAWQPWLCTLQPS